METATHILNSLKLPRLLYFINLVKSNYVTQQEIDIKYLGVYVLSN